MIQREFGALWLPGLLPGRVNTHLMLENLRHKFEKTGDRAHYESDLADLTDPDDVAENRSVHGQRCSQRNARASLHTLNAIDAQRLRAPSNPRLMPTASRLSMRDADPTRHLVIFVSAANRLLNAQEHLKNTT